VIDIRMDRQWYNKEVEMEKEKTLVLARII
jgi:hypothetical protein